MNNNFKHIILIFIFLYFASIQCFSQCDAARLYTYLHEETNEIYLMDFNAVNTKINKNNREILWTIHLKENIGYRFKLWILNSDNEKMSLILYNNQEDSINSVSGDRIKYKYLFDYDCKISGEYKVAIKCIDIPKKQICALGGLYYIIKTK